MFFAHDIVLVDDNLEDVNNSLDKWRLALEGRGLRISRNKTQYIIEYEFRRRDQEVEGMRRLMTIVADVIGEVDSFKCLGLLVQNDGIGIDVKYRIICG